MTGSTPGRIRWTLGFCKFYIRSQHETCHQQAVHVTFQCDGNHKIVPVMCLLRYRTWSFIRYPLIDYTVYPKMTAKYINSQMWQRSGKTWLVACINKWRHLNTCNRLLQLRASIMMHKHCIWRYIHISCVYIISTTDCTVVLFIHDKIERRYFNWYTGGGNSITAINAQRKWRINSVRFRHVNAEKWL